MATVAGHDDMFTDDVIAAPYEAFEYQPGIAFRALTSLPVVFT